MGGQTSRGGAEIVQGLAYSGLKWWPSRLDKNRGIRRVLQEGIECRLGKLRRRENRRRRPRRCPNRPKRWSVRSRDTWSWNARAARVGTVIQLGDEMDGAVESEELTMSMIADVHQVPADGAVPVDDIEFQESDIGVLGPVMWHGVDLRVGGGQPPWIVLHGGEEDM